MSRWRPYNKSGSTKNYSISRKLKKDGKINDAFEIMLNSLSLEEIIALKLETASKAMGNKLYGLPIWASLTNICKDAILKYAFSASKTKVEAGRFIGLSPIRFSKALSKYDTKSFFEEDNIKENSNGE